MGMYNNRIISFSIDHFNTFTCFQHDISLLFACKSKFDHDEDVDLFPMMHLEN